MSTNKNKKSAKAETAKAENKNTVSVLVIKPDGYAIVEAEKTEPAPVKGANKSVSFTLNARQHSKKKLKPFEGVGIEEVDLVRGVVKYTDGVEMAIDFKPFEKKETEPEEPFDIMKVLGIEPKLIGHGAPVFLGRGYTFTSLIPETEMKRGEWLLNGKPLPEEEKCYGLTPPELLMNHFNDAFDPNPPNSIFGDYLENKISERVKQRNQQLEKIILEFAKPAIKGHITKGKLRWRGIVLHVESFTHSYSKEYFFTQRGEKIGYSFIDKTTLPLPEWKLD